VNFSERRRKIAIDTDDERHACNSRHGTADAAGVAYRNKQSSKHPYEADAQRIGTGGDGLKHAAGGLDLFRRN